MILFWIIWNNFAWIWRLFFSIMSFFILIIQFSIFFNWAIILNANDCSHISCIDDVNVEFLIKIFYYIRFRMCNKTKSDKYKSKKCTWSRFQASSNERIWDSRQIFLRNLTSWRHVSTSMIVSLSISIRFENRKTKINRLWS